MGRRAELLGRRRADGLHLAGSDRQRGEGRFRSRERDGLGERRAGHTPFASAARSGSRTRRRPSRLPHDQDLLSIRTDGTDLRRIINDPHRDRGPAWSPDGEKIYFYSNRGGEYQIWRLRVDGSELEQVTQAEIHSTWFPTPSPDGSRLAFFNFSGTYLANVGRSLPVSEVESLPNPSSDVVFHGNSWSPDGSALAGVGWRGSWDTMDVLLLDLKSGDFRRLVELPRDARFEWEGSVEWLPDGRRVLVAGGGSIHVIDVETGSMREVLRPQPGSHLGSPMLPADAATLYYLRRNDESDVWMMSFAGADAATSGSEPEK